MTPTYHQSPLLAGIRGWTNEPPAAVQNELLDRLIAALGDYYAHLPLKRSASGVDPIERLRLLRAENEAEGRPDFLRRVLKIVNALRDRHTTLTLPAPLRNLVAYVPFVAERCEIGGREVYLVVKQLYGYEEIPIGAIVTHWNGVPIDLKIRRLAEDTQGANPAAARRLAEANLTIRSLAYVAMPDEDWATITYLDASGETQTVSTPWRFYQTGPLPTIGAGGSQHGVAAEQAASVGLDHHLLHVNEFKKQSAPKQNSLDLQEHQLGIRHGTVETPTGKVGYLRLFTFEVPNVREFLDVCAKILADLPQDRLIIDIRSNPGGQIPAGQKLIRMLTSKEILHLSPVAFRNTARTRKLGASGLFAPWKASLDLQYATGEAFSQAFPLTNYEDLPEYRYPGKIALIIDALCYSTSDFFSADFKDNDLGVVVGVDARTGGGGANVWPWAVLQAQTAAVGEALGPLPGGFDLNIAVRRSLRTGAEAGIPVEDLGVRADCVHRLTRTDILENNRELLEFAAAKMETQGR